MRSRSIMVRRLGGLIMARRSMDIMGIIATMVVTTEVVITGDITVDMVADTTEDTTEGITAGMTVGSLDAKGLYLMMMTCIWLYWR